MCDAHGFRHHAGEGSLAGQMQRSSSRGLVLAVQVQLQGKPQNALQLLYICLRLHINLRHSGCFEKRVCDSSPTVFLFSCSFFTLFLTFFPSFFNLF